MKYDLIVGEASVKWDYLLTPCRFVYGFQGAEENTPDPSYPVPCLSVTARPASEPQQVYSFKQKHIFIFDPTHMNAVFHLNKTVSRE